VRAPGFSGFSHFTGEKVEPEPVTTYGTSSMNSGSIPGFSGFGHAVGPMGGNPSLPGAAFVKGAVLAPTPAAPTAPVFSGFGHASGQMGGNPAIPKATSIAPKKPAAVSGGYIGSL
jgi:hypothetical protein